MLKLYDRPRRKMGYENVDVLCANNTREADRILRLYISRGYQLITLFPTHTADDSSETESSNSETSRPDTASSDAHTELHPDPMFYEHSASSREVIGQEYDKVIVVMDSNFYYNEFRELAGRNQPDPDYLFMRLFYQNITRARSRLCLVVLNNPEVFETLIRIKNNRLH